MSPFQRDDPTDREEQVTQIRQRHDFASCDATIASIEMERMDAAVQSIMLTACINNNYIFTG